MATPTTPPPTDADLVRRFRDAGDPDAFGQVAARHDRRMLGLARSILRHEADARDAGRQALVKQ